MDKNQYYLKTRISTIVTHISIVVVMCFVGTQLTYAQSSGSISGLVVDKESGDVLSFTNIALEGTSYGTASDLEGKFSFPQVPAGDYKMIVTYIGYKSKVVPISVVADGTVEVEVEMEYAAYQGEEVVVTAQASGQMGAINQQLNSNTIKNVVSADRIKDVPDANAAESVSRLPGLSLIRSGGEGQKVAIRGVSPKYNVTQVNGVRMQSTDRNDRSVDLNMISPNILSGVEVTKALTADMDADAVGGTVNLKIGKAAEGFNGNFSAQGGYGSLANNYDNYRLTGFLSNRFFDDKFGVQVSGFLDNYNRSSDVLSAGYGINEISQTDEDGLIPIDLSSVRITDRITDRVRTGGSLVLDYQFENGSLLMNNFASNLAQEQTTQSNGFNISGFQWDGTASDSESSNTVISNALQGEFEFPFFSMDFSLSNSISTQMGENLNMEIRIWQSKAGFSTPSLEDPRVVSPSEFLAAAKVIDGENDKRATRFQTLFRDVTEQAQEAALNFNVPFTLSNKISGKLKLGGKYVRNHRDNDETQNATDADRDQLGTEFIHAVQDSLWPELGLENIDRELGIRAFLFEDQPYDTGDEFLDGDAGVDDFFFKADIEKMHKYTELAQENGFYAIDARESTQYDYDYKRDFYAFYTSAEINIGKYLTLFPGIRYENFDIRYNAFNTEKFGPLVTDFRSEPISDDSNVGENWFPQMQMRIKPNDWLDLRLARTKSIIYPDYRSVSPYIFYDSYGPPNLNLGNPSLDPALSYNYDAYASFFKNKVGLVTAGVFYKEIENLIVSTSFRTKDPAKVNNRFDLTQTQQTAASTWINLDATSTVKGIELDWQTHLWYLPSFLKGIVLSVNYTKIVSETSYPLQTTRKIGSGPFAKTEFIDSLRTGRMPNQPDDIFNFTVGYDIGGFSARLSYVFTDNVLRGINRTYDELDTYTSAYKRWDFTAYQKLPWLEGQLQVYLNINNLTNTPDRAFTSVLEKLSSLEYYGRTVDLGLRYSF